MRRTLPGPPVAWFGLAAALITAWLYRAFIFDPEVMLFGQEMIDQSWQLREFAMSEIEADRGLPLWNPYLFGGLPYVAILPGPVFYPTTALYFLMPLFRAIGWTFVLHTFLAGLFAWFAARSLSLRRWPAAVSGLAFMLTGFFVSMNYAGHDGRMFTIALIPLAFAFLERGLQSRRIHWFLAMGLVVACQIFTPHVQLMYYSSLALSLYMLVRVIWMARDEGDWKPAGRVFGFYALGFAAAAAIGMAQLLPTLELREIAVRGSTGLTGYDFASSWAVPAQEVTALVLPDLIGSLESYWGANPFKQHTEYVGIVPAALAVIGLTTARRDRRTGLIAGIAVLCVLFALGAATPVHRLAYEIVPMVREFRAASMMMGPAAFFVALLAGIGWERVLDVREAWATPEGGGEAGREPTSNGLAWPWIFALSAPILLLGLAAALSPDGLVRWVHTSWYPERWPQPSAAAIGVLQASGWLLLGIWGSVLALAFGVARRRLPAEVVLAVLALLVLDLARVDQRYISVTTPAEHFAPDALQTALQNDMDPLSRVFPLEGYGPNAMMVHDIRSVTGMQNFRLEWTETLLGGLGYRNLGAPALWPLLDLEYVITRQEVQTPLLERGPTGPRGTAWRVAGDFPHAWFPDEIERQPPAGRATVQRLAERRSPAEFALVAPADEAESGAGAAGLPSAGRGTARVTSFTPNEVLLEVDAESGGLLVLSEIFHPNWRAFVDGEETPVWRTDLALRGVEVPTGRHTVRLAYSARSVGRGLLVGAFGLLACLAGIIVSWRSGRRRSGSGDVESADAEGAGA